MPRGGLLEEVAGAILDGTPLDWAEVDSRADETDRGLLEELRTLAALKGASRTAVTSPAVQPELWGHLRVLERIGRGAFGEVYRAWDTRLDREVALKLLPAPRSDEDAAQSSVIEEGRLLARVRHPNVVTIYGAERLAGRIGLWMELVRGRTLEEVLRNGKTFTAREVARIGVELCGAVSAVHAAGLLHRDIKAQNVMVAEDGRLVLMDFGTGMESRDRSDAHAAGTPLYLAPELLSEAPATPGSDVYSIGVVLYHLLTGAYPVQARDLADLRRAHARGDRKTIWSARADVPRRLARIVERAIEPRPDQRYDTAESLGAALAGIERRRPILRVALATAAAIVIGATVWLARAPGGGSAPAAPLSLLAPAAAGARLTGPPVIAVLPFRNLSSASDGGYFADGLTEEIIRNLAAIEGLQVRSQTSSFFFKDKPHDVAQIGERLRVNLIVAGSVQREGRRLRINAQLVSVNGDVPLWSERYDRTLDEVFAIQDEISRAIVNKLRLSLGRGQRRYQPPVEAYDLYLQARALLGRRGTENAQRAAALLEQVIAMDPSYAPAYAGLADAYESMSWQIPGLPPDEGLRRMRPAAMKAIELDPLLAEAHAAMGQTHARALDWRKAQESFDRAIELNPSLTHIHTNYSASTLLPVGEVGRALELLDAALVADPLSLEVRVDLAFAQIVAGRYDDAVEHLRHVLAIDPEFRSGLQLARALTFGGRPAEAVALWESQPPSRRGWERWLTHAYVRTGQREEVDRLVQANRNDHPYRQALVYAAVGDKDRTFAALDRAIDLMPQRTALLLVLPEMSLLRGDARLDALRKRLRLP